MPWSPSSDDEAAALADRVLLGVGEHVHDAGAAAVRLGPAEAKHVDVLAGDRADDVGAGDEDPALRPEDHRVGQRRTVGGTAGGGAEHDGDLRDLARRLRHRVEDQPDGLQRQHALGQPGAAGVPEPDDRRLVGHRPLVRLDHDLAALVAHRAAHHGGVGAEGDRVHAVDRADRSQHAAVVVVADQLERARVEERREPLVRDCAGPLRGAASAASRW